LFAGSIEGADGKLDSITWVVPVLLANNWTVVVNIANVDDVIDIALFVKKLLGKNNDI
jgi:hypothetical protein